MIHVDAAFVISLPRRPDRLAEFQAGMPADWPLPPPHVFDAVDGVQQVIPDWWKSTPGAWGCYRSHERLLAQALQDGLDRVLVLEDDCRFSADFPDRVRGLDVPADAEQLYLGGQHLTHAPAGPPGLRIGRNINRTHAYAVLGADAIRKILDHLRPDPGLWTARHHVDHHYGLLHRTGAIRAYAVTPWICGQDAGRSDVGKSCTTERWWR